MMVSRPEFLSQLLSQFDSPAYLEVGVNEGQTFLPLSARRKVAVDPKFVFDVAAAKAANDGSEFHEVTSDVYFCDIATREDLFDVIYLDGLHTFEQTLRDFTNSLSFLNENGVIVVDDVVPTSYQAGLPSQLDSFKVKAFLTDADASWMGDTFKLVFFVESFFPMYELRTIIDNHGQAVIWRGDKARSAFSTYSAEELSRLQFVDIVKQESIFRRMASSEILSEIRNRRGAIR